MSRYIRYWNVNIVLYLDSQRGIANARLETIWDTLKGRYEVQFSRLCFGHRPGRTLEEGTRTQEVVEL